MNYLYVEMAINALFSLEFIVKVIASGIRGYLKVGWNMLDFLVVVDGWLIVIIYYVGMTDRFTLSMRMLKMARLLRPLRFLSINPTLRGIMNGLFKSVNDLGSTLILIGFFMTVYGVLMCALLSGNMRYRCYDSSSKTFYENRALICSRYKTIGRQCTREGSLCVDSGSGPYAQLEGLAPFYLAQYGHEASPFDANPPYTPPFDSFGWSILAVFQVWTGVGWTTLMYHAADTAGRPYEAIFMIMHITGAWFLVNLMVAVLGVSFEREQARQKALTAASKRALQRFGGKASFKDRTRHLVDSLRHHEILGSGGSSRKDSWKRKGGAAAWSEKGYLAGLAAKACKTTEAGAAAGSRLANFAMDAHGVKRHLDDRRRSPPPSPPYPSFEGSEHELAPAISPRRTATRRRGGGGSSPGTFADGSWSQVAVAAAPTTSPTSFQEETRLQELNETSAMAKGGTPSPPPSPPAPVKTGFGGQTSVNVQEMAALMIQRRIRGNQTRVRLGLRRSRRRRISHEVENLMAEVAEKRTRVKRIVRSFKFRALIVAVILASTISTAYDGPFVAAEFGQESGASGLNWANNIFGIFFLVEGLLKIAAFGPREYFTGSGGSLNTFDFVNNVVFVIERILSSAGISTGGILKSLKAFRLIRFFRLAASLDSFRSLMHKMARSMAAVFSMLIVIFILTFFIAVGCLHLFHDMYDAKYGGKCTGVAGQFTIGDGGNATDYHSHTCAAKPRHHFDNIALSFITIFQILTTDNWVGVMWDTYDATGTLSLPLFPATIIFGNLIILNIFLAILLSTFSVESKIEATAEVEREEKEAIATQEAAAEAAKITANADLRLDRQRRPSPKRSVSSSPARSAGRRSPNRWQASPNRWTSPVADVDRRSRSSDSRFNASRSPREHAIHLADWGGSSALIAAGLRKSDLARAVQAAQNSPGASTIAAAAAVTLGPDMTLRAVRVFREKDVDKSGSVDIDELREALFELGLENTQERVEEAMREFDLDGNRLLDLAEFLVLVRNSPNAPPSRLGRSLLSLLPAWIQNTQFVRKYVDAAALRAAKAVRLRAEQRQKRQRIGRKIRRSKMRARRGKYGSLNAWEVAYFRGCFKRADIDGDGYLALEDVYRLVAEVDEEPRLSETWEVLDANATRDDLVGIDEFLVFISIKRRDELAIIEADGVQESSLQQAMRKDKVQLRIAARSKMNRRYRHRYWWNLISHQLWLFQRRLSRVYLDRLPALGEFGREGIGEERSRSYQRLIYSRGFWILQVSLIVSSAVLVTSEIDAFVRRMRLAGGQPSLSSDSVLPRWVVACFDSAFLFVSFCEVMVKVLTEGIWHTIRSPWNMLDIFCLTSATLRLVFNFANMRRLLLSFSSLRIFMLVPRFQELKLLFESILRALPNVIMTMGSLCLIWLMFAILGVSIFGGTSHQCARLSDAHGYAGCGVNFGSASHSSPIKCRYALHPLPVPADVVPGVTRSTDCGCTWSDGEMQCSITNNSFGEQLVWIPAYPNFDTTSQALLALLQISTLDGWSRIMYFGMDGTQIDHQPARETSYAYPIFFYILFIIFGVLFATNVFVGVVIDEFKKIRRRYDGSAALTEEQVKWVNTQRLLLRLSPEKRVTFEPPPTQPQRLMCFRLVHDEEAIGRPVNAPADAKFFGKSFEKFVLGVIILNVLQLMLYSDPIEPATLGLYEFLNYFFVLFFAIEAIIRIVALSFKEYMRSAWNAFDFFLAVFGVLATIATVFAVFVLQVDVNSEPGMRWLRCVRALRIVRLATSSPSLFKMMRTMLFASPSIANITIGIFLFTSAYAQFGMAFLGTVVYDYEGAGLSRHANFETAFRSFSALVRMSTADSWSAILADVVHNPHVAGVEPPLPVTVYFFFVFFMGFMRWVLISIFVAIILEYFNDSNAEEGISISYEDIESFQRKWLEFDHKSSSYIRTVDLGLLLYSCKPPLVSVMQDKTGFFESPKFIRPSSLSEVETILVELDVPEHDGSVHFLEVLLALLQRMTGIIYEEQIMEKLLSLHPGYVSTIKSMPPITGSTADPYVKSEMMAHLKRALGALGIVGEEDNTFKTKSSGSSFRSSSSFALTARSASLARSFSKRLRPAHEQEMSHQKKARELEARRASLSQMATSNAQQRTVIEQINAKARDQRANSRKWRVAGTAVLATALGGGSSFSKKHGDGSGKKRKEERVNVLDDALSC